MKISKFDEQYSIILKKGIDYLLKQYKNVSVDMENVIIVRETLFEFKKPFKLSTNKRFHIFSVDNQNVSTTSKHSINLIVLDNEEKRISYFCTRNINWCSLGNKTAFEKFIRKSFGNKWSSSYIPAMFTSPIKKNKNDLDIFKTEYKNLLWNFFWLSLKFKNPKISDDILLEYFINNVKKRKDIKNLLVEFYEKINK